MARRSHQAIAETAIFLGLAMFAASASAADLAGKWYGRLDAEPTITITKAGSGYSASLDYPDITRSVRRPSDIHPLLQSIHKDLISFDVVGDAVRFTIRSTISSNGDLNSARDEYDLMLSGDERKLTGKVRHTSNHEAGLTYDHVPVTVAALFPSDWASRTVKSPVQVTR